MRKSKHIPKATAVFLVAFVGFLTAPGATIGVGKPLPLDYIEHWGGFQMLIESGAKAKTIKQKIHFLWEPTFPEGALGYDVSLLCQRSVAGKGRVLAKKVTLEGLDSGTVVNVGKSGARWQDTVAFTRLFARSTAPRELAGESMVLVRGEIVAKKNFVGQERVSCYLLLVEGVR